MEPRKPSDAVWAIQSRDDLVAFMTMLREVLHERPDWWEPIAFGELLVGPPIFLLDEHPGGIHVAMKAGWYAAVWSRDTGRIVWGPKPADGLCWLPRGDQLVQARFYELARYTWPTGGSLSTCHVQHPGWPHEVVASPRGDLAAFVWLEQDKAGFELVAIRHGGDQQVHGAGYETRLRCISTPGFSADGRFLVLPCGWFAFWNDEHDEGVPCPGGRWRVGHILGRDLDMGTSQEIPVDEDVPAGWLPPGGEADLCVDVPMGPPQFDRREADAPALPGFGDLLQGTLQFTVPLLTGTIKRFAVLITPPEVEG